MLGFRHGTEADDPATLALFGAAFGKSFSPAWWLWYRTNPVGPNHTHAVVEDGQIIGSYSLMPMLLKVGDSATLAALCHNVCVSPDHQGRGIFTDLGRYALAEAGRTGTRYAVGMPNLKALPGHLKVGWQVLAPLSFLVRPHPLGLRHHGCVGVDSFGPEVDDLLEETQAPLAFAVVKDHRWLNWRLVEHPERTYHRFVLRRNGNCDGLVVVKHFDGDGVRKSHVVELQARNGWALANLLAAAEHCATGRDLLNLWTNPRDPYREILLALGYEEQPSNDRIIVHGCGGAVAVPDGSIAFAFGDNDVY